MANLTTSSTRLSESILPKNSWQSGSVNLDHLMSSRELCPCCSSILLCHVSLGKLYWRCSHCYQAMPVVEDYIKLVT